jgi:3-oxoacyl-[acyl-carrier-protein] synthase III
VTRVATLSGLGGYVPDRLVTNADLTAELDTSEEWIVSRTGIRTRYVVADGEATSDLAVRAGERALRSSGSTTVDALIVATATPDYPCPATAPEVATRLGLGGVPAFDVAAVCTGFIYALASASGLIAAELAESVLVIGADAFSSILDPTDRTTRAIFGDGAGAVVLRAGAADEDGAIAAFDLGSDGARGALITVPAGGSRQRSGGAPVDVKNSYFTMQGREVFMNAVVRMSESAQAAMKRAGWTEDAVDCLVPHQANERILRAVADQMGLPSTRVASNIERLGSTVAASIPLALADAAVGGRLTPGDRVILTGFGGGLTWGSVALTWPDVPIEAV